MTLLERGFPGSALSRSIGQNAVVVLASQRWVPWNMSLQIFLTFVIAVEYACSEAMKFLTFLPVNEMTQTRFSINK